MKLNLLIALVLPLAFYAQDSTKVVMSTGDYPNAFSSGSANVQPFNNSSRLFRDWSVSVGGGAAFMHAADVNSFYDGDVNFGWNAYASLDKQITHTFGMSLQYQMGKTNQKAMLPGAAGVAAALSLEKELNFREMSKNVEIIAELQERLKKQGVL